MRLIKPSFEILEQDVSGKPKGIVTSPETIQEALLLGVYKHIEKCGRTCYKSEDLMTDESAKPFVDRLIKSKHGAMLEHGTIYLYIPWNEYYDKEANFRYFYNKYSVHRRIEGDGVYITTNLRVILENGWEKDLQYICEPTEHHALRHTVKFVCNRQVSHEFVRHRVMSFAQESTRFCNYTKGRFGGELTFIEPCWNEEREDLNNWEDVPAEFTMLYAHLLEVENTYFDLIQKGWKPQQAATILPNALKTELIVTGFDKDWEHFFDLRAKGVTGPPHPQAKELAYPLMEEFIKRGYISPDFAKV